MLNKKSLKNKLNEINEILIPDSVDINHCGVLSGLGGIAMFKYYYARFMNCGQSADTGYYFIRKSFDLVNEGYNFPTYCTGIAGLGWLVDHLDIHGFIEIDSDSVLRDFDSFLFDVMKKEFENGNYDFLHGGIGYGYYFLNRYKNTKSSELRNKYKSYILSLIVLLRNAGEENEDYMKWPSPFPHKEEEGYKEVNLGFAHGIPSILNFISRLQNLEEFREGLEDILLKGANYILSFKYYNPDSLSVFPSYINDGAEFPSSRIAWCYGDLGVGMSLLRASKSIKNRTLYNTSVDLLKITSKRKTSETTMVVDAGVCHGSFGNAQIYHWIFKETHIGLFKEMRNFWLTDGMQKSTFENGYAGFKQWKGGSWIPELSLLNGISGIGLCLISSLSNHKTWDESLMIS